MVTPGHPQPVRLSWGPSGHAKRLLTLALAGLAIAVLARRAEFAAAAAPAVLLLATWRRDRPRSVLVSATLTARRMVEGEVELHLGRSVEKAEEPVPDFARLVELVD